MEVPIPPRIVLLGTSKISLNERFSKLPVTMRRRPLGSSTTTSYRSAEHDYREPDIDIDYTVSDFKNNNSAADEESDVGYDVRYVQRYGASAAAVGAAIRPVRNAARPSRSFWRPFRPFKIRDRLTYPPKRNYIAFASNRAYIRRGAFSGSRTTFGLSRQVKNVRVRQNGFNNVFKGEQRYVNRNPQRGGSIRVIRGKARSAFQAFPRRQPISREQLDRELDAYMKRSKHPKIDVSDLMQT